MEFQVQDANFEEIQEGKIAETGTYKLLLINQEMKPTKADDGTNLVLDWQIIEDPSAEGIIFSTYNAMPKAGDEEKMTKRGQSYKDMKLSFLRDFVTQIGGSVSLSSFTIPDDIIVTAIVEKKLSEEGRAYNQLDESTMKPFTQAKLDLD